MANVRHQPPRVSAAGCMPLLWRLDLYFLRVR
jgi:hypothetical protein